MTDSGEGIPAEDIDHVFERFYRADSARAADTGGAGLGLAISKRIVADHGGETFAESELGSGTTVGFRMPLAERDDRYRSKRLCDSSGSSGSEPDRMSASSATSSLSSPALYSVTVEKIECTMSSGRLPTKPRHDLLEPLLPEQLAPASCLGDAVAVGDEAIVTLDVADVVVELDV